MIHLVLFGYIISFAVGFATIIFAVLFYLKERSEWVKYYLFLLISFTVLLIIYTFQLYNVINFKVSSTVLYIFIYINLGVMVYMIPFVISKIVSFHWAKIHNSIFIPLLAAYIVMLILSFSLKNNIVFYSIMNAIFYGSLIYSLIIAIIRLNRIKERHFKTITGIFILLSCIFIPFFFMDTYLAKFFAERDKTFAYRAGALPLYYFWWNVTVLGYLLGYFYRIRTKHVDTLSDGFIKEFHITGREQEVIALIMKGQTNKDIGAKLNISPNTVNNHIANIFEKTGYRSRFELITLVQTRL